jgi:mannose-6-phosphate isomerase-like protein (cupin superfamily)
MLACTEPTRSDGGPGCRAASAERCSHGHYFKGNPSARGENGPSDARQRPNSPRGHTPGAFNGGPIEHSDITEIYQFLSGHATFVTGGTILNPKVNPTHGGPGPSVSGTGVENGVTREVGPGDVVIIPPNTPHFFSQIDSQIMYMIYRVDTHHIWDMSGDKKHHQ